MCPPGQRLCYFGTGLNQSAKFSTPLMKFCKPEVACGQVLHRLNLKHNPIIRDKQVVSRIDAVSFDGHTIRAHMPRLFDDKTLDESNIEADLPDTQSSTYVALQSDSETDSESSNYSEDSNESAEIMEIISTWRDRSDV